MLHSLNKFILSNTYGQASRFESGQNCGCDLFIRGFKEAAWGKSTSFRADEARTKAKRRRDRETKKIERRQEQISWLFAIPMKKNAPKTILLLSKNNFIYFWKFLLMSLVPEFRTGDQLIMIHVSAVLFQIHPLWFFFHLFWMSQNGVRETWNGC